MFKPHKDSEKAEGMFGTMVICLPSPHQGGDVLVSMGGKTETMSTAASSEWECSFLAWYSDVVHEVKPVQSGHRVVLTYNLIYTSSVQLPSVFKLEQDKADLQQTLEDWRAANERANDLPGYLAYPLKHQYTAANISYNHLKGEDAARALSISQIGDELGFICLLAIVDRTLTRPGDEDGDGEDMSDYEKEEVSLDQVVSLPGKKLLQHVTITADKLTAEDSWSAEPSHTDTEYTGNEGVNRTYWYKACVRTTSSHETRLLT